MQKHCINMQVSYVIHHIPSDDKDKACLSAPLVKFQLRNFLYCSIRHQGNWRKSDEL